MSGFRPSISIITFKVYDLNILIKRQNGRVDKNTTHLYADYKKLTSNSRM